MAFSKKYLDSFLREMTMAGADVHHEGIRRGSGAGQRFAKPLVNGLSHQMLDNSAVMYRTAEWRDGTKKETSDIAKDARGYTLLITCTVNEQSASAKKGN